MLILNNFQALQSVFSITIPWAIYTIFGPSHNQEHVKEISFTTYVTQNILIQQLQVWIIFS